jgi:hypothetical protein
VFTPGTGTATAYRDVAVVLHARGADTYDLYVQRSFAASLWAWLADAAAGVVDDGGESRATSRDTRAAAEPPDAAEGAG